VGVILTCPDCKCCGEIIELLDDSNFCLFLRVEDDIERLTILDMKCASCKAVNYIGEYTFQGGMPLDEYHDEPVD